MKSNDNLTTNKTGEVTVKLNSKGKYTWTITVDILPNDLKDGLGGTSEAINLVKTYDLKLKDAFPNHASGRSSGFHKL